MFSVVVIVDVEAGVLGVVEIVIIENIYHCFYIFSLSPTQKQQSMYQTNLFLRVKRK